MISEHTLFKMM